jgi:hypothetical protein
MILAKKINRGKVRKIRIKRVGQSTQNFPKFKLEEAPEISYQGFSNCVPRIPKSFK